MEINTKISDATIHKAKRLMARYINDNPCEGLDYRPFYEDKIMRGPDYRYEADLDKIYPDAALGDKAYVKCCYISGGDMKLGLRITLFGPAALYVNGSMFFKSDVFCERNNHIDICLEVPLTKGVNEFLFVFTKSALGFGGKFGTHIAKWDYIFMRPDELSMEGCIYSLNSMPEKTAFEKADIKLGDGEYALFYAKTKDGEDYFVKGTAFPEDGDFVNPCGVSGFGAFLGLWPLKETEKADLIAPSEGTFWRFKYKDVWLRPYYKGSNFGKWNYPLGVTMYGLMRAGAAFDDEEALKYVKDHMHFAVKTFPYSLWDKEKHGGAASLHNLLCSIDSLDDCGSFGAAVEEAKISLGFDEGDEICDIVSDYITNKQHRTGRGAFCRKDQLHFFHNDTMWLDDMYMSVPFLVRRYAITGDEKAIDDAANQFFCYVDTHRMENGLLSHVYDMRHKRQTRVAWGRGNGWFLFSISELLAFMPKNHERRAALEELFKDLCEKYAAYQTEDGRWRQVINEEDAYLETSVSAMFACAYARGFKMGLLDEIYKERAIKAVNSIALNAIDEDGNLYGVCRGSEFSFASEYYKKDLLPRTNDTHGVGIVLLAVVECM